MKNQIFAYGMATFLGGTAFAATISVPAGNITTDTKWTADNTYVLEGVVNVKGATLDIAPGTIVRGQPDSTSLIAGSLVITPTGKVQIRGTSTNPVIFTTAALDVDGDDNYDVVSGKPVRWTAGQDAFFLDADPKNSPLTPLNPAGQKNMQLWGGIVVMGDASTNNGNQVDIDADTVFDAGFGIVEGLSGTDAIYGGFNDAHNAGSIKYVSIRHGGVGLAADKEVNALTFYSVGSLTTVENVDIYCTSDDGVEIFGGLVSMKNININYADDDGFDVDEGWRGVAQFVFVLQGHGYGDSGMEIDGEDKSENQAPATIDPLPNGRFYNFTVWHAKTASAATRFRAGFAGALVNSAIQNIAGDGLGTGVRIDGISGIETAPTARDNFNSGTFQVRNNSVAGFTTSYQAVSGTIAMSATGAVTGTFAGEAIPNVFYPNTNNRNNLALFDVGAINHSSANGINPRPLSSASAGAYQTPVDPAYVAAPAVFTAYRGAFDRASSTLWTTGWTALNKRGVLSN